MYWSVPTAASAVSSIACPLAAVDNRGGTFQKTSDENVRRSRDRANTDGRQAWRAFRQQCRVGQSCRAGPCWFALSPVARPLRSRLPPPRRPLVPRRRPPRTRPSADRGAVDRGAFGDGERQVSEHTDAQGRKWLGDVPYDVFFDDPLGVAAEGRSEIGPKLPRPRPLKPKSEVAAVERSHASSTAAPATSAPIPDHRRPPSPARTGRQTGRRLRRLG